MLFRCLAFMSYLPLPFDTPPPKQSSKLNGFGRIHRGAGFADLIADGVGSIHRRLAFVESSVQRIWESNAHAKQRIWTRIEFYSSAQREHTKSIARQHVEHQTVKTHCKNTHTIYRTDFTKSIAKRIGNWARNEFAKAIGQNSTLERVCRFSRKADFADFVAGLILQDPSQNESHNIHCNMFQKAIGSLCI